MDIKTLSFKFIKFLKMKRCLKNILFLFLFFGLIEANSKTRSYSNLFQQNSSFNKNNYDLERATVPDSRTKYNTQFPLNTYNVQEQKQLSKSATRYKDVLQPKHTQTLLSQNDIQRQQSLQSIQRQQSLQSIHRRLNSKLSSASRSNLPQQSVPQNYYNISQTLNSQNTKQINSHFSLQPCNVPSDFWCDSYELAQRCNVVSQCESLKRERRPLIVTLMYEALCPFCQRFITNHLGNLYSQFSDRIEVELIPWGNSILLRNGQISCNHGPKECDANRLMSCVLDQVKTAQAIPFIICFERALTNQQSVDQAFHHCAGFVRNTYRTIKECHGSEKGKQLQRQAAYRTMNVQVNKIKEVPYILINNYSPNTDSNALNILSLQRFIQKWLNLRS